MPLRLGPSKAAGGLYVETVVQTVPQTVVKTVQTVETAKEGVLSRDPLFSVSTVCTVFTTVCTTVSAQRRYAEPWKGCVKI